MKRIKFEVIKEDAGYSATADYKGNFIAIEGDSVGELYSNGLEASRLALEDDTLTHKNIKLDFDMASFFHFYRVINKKALSERIGMNQSQLQQYISGIKKPSYRQKKKILLGVQEIGRELTEVSFL